MYIFFVDCKKAYYRVDREKLFATFETVKEKKHLLNAIKDLYKYTSVMLKTGSLAVEQLRTNLSARRVVVYQ
jgi:hypothetical protein